MGAKWIYLVMLDLFLLTYSKPGGFYHDIHKPDHGRPPWGPGEWSHGWDGHDWAHDWHGPTTQRAKTRGTTAKTTGVQRRDGNRSPTPPLQQPTISDIDLRVGELTSSASPAPTFKPFVPDETPSPPKDTGLTFQIAEFVTGPDDDKTDTASDAKGDNEKDQMEDSSSAEDDKKDSSDVVIIPGVKDESSDTEATADASENMGTGNSMSDELKASRWHVGIYERTKSKEFEHKEYIYTYKCGGSLIKRDLVISAGHCFWSPVWQDLPITDFGLAAGKLYPQWDDPRDTNVQYSNIRKIRLTPMQEPCFEPDLAFLTVEPFDFNGFVKPVCISFDEELENQHLSEGSFGKIASSAALENGDCKPSQQINWLSLPYIDVKACSDNEIVVTRLSNRICAGEINNTTHCETDSGNGLVFFQNKTPYLRGVASFIATDRLCFKFNTRSFTNLLAAKNKAEDRVKEIFDNLILEECESLYRQNNSANQTVTLNEADNSDNETNWFGIQGVGSQPVPSLDGASAPAFQWHVGVYSKRWSPYMQICGGSLVKRDFVLSAAHCFWDSSTGLQPASRFAVAGGKLYRPWNDLQDVYSQHSDVAEIMIPVRFRGSATSFQDDIAILRLSIPFTYAPGVQSVCVDFGMAFDREQLQPGNVGTVAGWGLTEENGVPSQRLNYLRLPYVDLEECFASSDPSFYKYITSDKICAGTQTGKALCRGDSGGGLVLFSNSETPYLRGIASTASNNDNLCNAYTLAAFTHIYAHRSFLRDNIPDIEKECAPNITPDADNVGHEIQNGGTDRDAKGNVGAGNTAALVEKGNVAPDPTPWHSNVPYNHFVCNCNCKN